MYTVHTQPTVCKGIMSEQLLRPVLLAGRDGEQRTFGGQRDLDYSALRVWWLHTLLRGKVEAQGTRLSKPRKKGTCLIGNSRGIAVRVRRLLSGSGKALDTFHQKKPVMPYIAICYNRVLYITISALCCTKCNNSIMASKAYPPYL